jgi:hypothetical protein
MNKDYYWYLCIIFDYLFEEQAKKISAYNIKEWAKFLCRMNFNSTVDVYAYLDNKIKEENANT